MFRGIAIDGNSELRHAVDLRRADLVIPKAGYGNRHGFKQAFGLYVDGVQQAMAVVIGDATAGGHATHYSARLRFCFAYPNGSSLPVCITGGWLSFKRRSVQ